MKALVIGSEGNIGIPLVQYLKKKHYEVLTADIVPGWKSKYLVADINHPIDLLPAFDWKPDVVFILSAMVSRVTCEQASGLAIATNLSGINNVLQLCKRVNAMTIFFSTSEIYGPECTLMDETISNPKPNNRYGLSKLLGESLVEYEVREYGLRAVTLRPFMVYDENESLGDHRSAMIRFAYNLSRKLPIEVHKGCSRGWLHISDAIRAIEAAVHLKKYFAINIGHPDIRTIEELAEKIRLNLNAPKELVHLIDIPSRMTSVKKPVLERQKNILGIEPKVSFDDGIDLVCNKIKQRIITSEKI
ncbi:NAD-dependent epimerase/dehydratase family protein [Chlamydiota bacterium]